MNDGFYCMDCMDGMKQLPDKFFELAIVDPIYGDVKAGGYMTGKSAGGVGPHPKYNYSIWSQRKTNETYFDELFRVSKNQIIWGGNYFSTMLRKDSSCWIVWDKCNGESNFADFEIAWTSFTTASRLFRFMWNGMLQGKSIANGHLMQGDKTKNEIRIHPTQKPIALYKWLLTKYANKGDKILDTHVGSASSLIACRQLGFRYWGFEIDPDYYKVACERLDREKAQVNMIDLLPEQTLMDLAGANE